MNTIRLVTHAKVTLVGGAVRYDPTQGRTPAARIASFKAMKRELVQDGRVECVEEHVQDVGAAPYA